MARLIYSAIQSLDGYIADSSGRFDWAAPDEEVHAFVNELERPIGTYLFGRRMYETMAVWETLADRPGQSAVVREFAAIWGAADKVVYSRTLRTVSSARTRLEREFDPEAVARLKTESARDLSIGGPTLAGAAIAAGLVDEFHVLVTPILVGGGLASLPALPAGTSVRLELVAERRFAGGVVHLQYRSA